MSAGKRGFLEQILFPFLRSSQDRLDRSARLVAEVEGRLADATGRLDKSERELDELRQRAQRTPFFYASIEGSLDRLDRHGLAGWAYDAEAPDRPVTVSIYVRDHVVAQMNAREFREDLHNAGKGDGCHAFHYEFDYEIDEGELDSVTVRADERVLKRASPLSSYRDSAPKKNIERPVAKALHDISSKRLYQTEVCFSDKLGVVVQPQSYSVFGAHPDFVDAFHLFTQNNPSYGLDFARVWSMVLNVKYALSKTKGSIAELGVYQGNSSALLSFYAKKFDRKMYMADTFQGFSEQQFKSEENATERKLAAFKDTSLESAQAVVGDYAGNRWIVGMFPDSITEEMRADTYAFVSIDCDIYEPIMEGLKFFWPRMTAGGMIFIHDYSSGHWPGATQAVDEFCAVHGAAGCILPDMAGSFVLAKPGNR